MLRFPKYTTDIRKSSKTLFRQGGPISHSGLVSKGALQWLLVNDFLDKATFFNIIDDKMSR